ncbi:MAG: HNH endonuclease [Elusimicrobiota bacterium]|jgi:5-methylcytosine-specific restriction endonuclease McrA|nr:HNH endonuclease [Elusimicrobiota bacterium]
MKKISQSKLLKSFFVKNPNRDIEHPEVVDWVTAEYKKLTGEVFRDPDRQIRKFHQVGLLIKVRKGVYRYDPKFAHKRILEEFTQVQKEAILKRDGYKCVICGRGIKEGVELHIDHVIAKDLGGKATMDNGQVLCSRCNFMKKKAKQTESGKKMFIRLYELSKKENQKDVLDFVTEVLEVYEKHGVNGHIAWNKDK